MDKDKLKQYTDIKCEIKSLQERLAKCRIPDPVHDAVTGSTPYIPYQPHTIHIFGVEYEKHQAKRDRLNRMLMDRLTKCQDLETEVTEFICAIPDSRTRRVFDMRYLDNMSWRAIARALNTSDESYPRKDIHDKYLNNL